MEGYSTISIASKLNDAGIRTRKNNPWTPASIYLILKNETYTGVIRKGVKKSKKYETIHGLHTPIIERSIYDEVQRIFRKRYRRAGAKIYR